MKQGLDYISPEVNIIDIDLKSIILATSTGAGSGGTDGGWDDDD